MSRRDEKADETRTSLIGSLLASLVVLWGLVAMDKPVTGNEWIAAIAIAVLTPPAAALVVSLFKEDGDGEWLLAISIILVVPLSVAVLMESIQSSRVTQEARTDILRAHPGLDISYLKVSDRVLQYRDKNTGLFCRVDIYNSRDKLTAEGGPLPLPRPDGFSIDVKTAECGTRNFG